MPKKILVVEDHADILKMMSIFLRMHGYEVIEASDGYEAVELALETHPDIILMDIAMPVLDGVYSTRAMRDHEELADTPILGISAYSDFYSERAKAAGFDQVIPKPIDFAQLDSMISSLTR